jgi:hypothetical protein
MECATGADSFPAAGGSRMKKILGIGLCTVALPALAAAAEIHGTLSENGKPVEAGVALKLDCGGASATAATDKFGSYSLKTSGTGECTVSVDYKGASPSLKVTVYEKPSRYDLVLKQDGGKTTLARK